MITIISIITIITIIAIFCRAGASNGGQWLHDQKK
jgi:hypothetical protein